MPVAIDAVGIRMGGAGVILTDLVPRLCQVRPSWSSRLFLLPPHNRYLSDPPGAPHLQVQWVPLRPAPLAQLKRVCHKLPVPPHVFVLRSAQPTGRLGVVLDGARRAWLALVASDR